MPCSTLDRQRDLRWLLVMQGLSLFNDHLFKQVVLLSLLAVKSPAGVTRDAQGWAVMAFALPFLVFSGMAGFAVDRFEKRRVLWIVKASEVLVMLAATLALWQPAKTQPVYLVVVLFAMAAQTAFLVPAKYSILASIVPDLQLPRANAWMQILAYGAIVMGAAAAGGLMTVFYEQRAWIGGVCVGTALLGLAAASRIRPVGHANRQLPWDHRNWFVPAGGWNSVRRDPLLAEALVVYAFFWLVAGVVQPAINAVGRLQLGANEWQTSCLLAVSATGIARGCALSGWLTRDVVPARILLISAMAMILMQLALGWPSGGLVEEGHYGGFLLGLGLLGFSSGMFIVPLHVQVQVRAPKNEKGQMLALQNWVNWLAVLASGATYGLLRWAVKWLGWPPNGIFVWLAIIALLGLTIFRPGHEQLLRRTRSR